MATMGETLDDRVRERGLEAVVALLGRGGLVDLGVVMPRAPSKRRAWLLEAAGIAEGPRSPRKCVPSSQRTPA